MANDEDELKNLPPRERIRRLKELEEKRKKEIEEAQKLIKESEEEISAREEWERKVPIPQVAREDFTESTSEEKEILEAHKGRRERREKPEEKKEERRVRGGVEEILDLGKGIGERGHIEVIAGERREIPRELFDTDYAAHLSRQPIDRIREELYGIKERVSEKGYLNEEDQRRIEYRLAGIEMKEEAAEMGQYKSFSEEAAHRASLAKELGVEMLRGYVSKEGRGGKMYRAG